MKTKITYALLLALLATSLSSFLLTDFNKTIIGKWELKTIQSPGKPAMDTKSVLGESFMQFNSDFTYNETGWRETKGIWKIVDNKYLQTKGEKQADFTEKIELKELASDKIEMSTSDKKKFVYQLVK